MALWTKTFGYLEDHWRLREQGRDGRRCGSLKGVIRMTPSGSSRLGAAVNLDELSRDPYPIFQRLRELEPISWIDHLGMWYVTRYNHVREVLSDAERFTTRFEASTIFDTFGAQMLTSDGSEQRRYRDQFRAAFTPAAVRSRMETALRECAIALVSALQPNSSAELRVEFAARLPVLGILAMFGLPASEEPRLRHWYDTFEEALANFSHEASVRAKAREHVSEFHALLQRYIVATTGTSTGTLLSELVNKPAAERLTDEEIKRNLSIVFFGGISTVEALILNSMYALFNHPAAYSRVRSEYGLIPAVIEEVMRWLSPVQSAVRHATTDVELGGVRIRAGDTVSCMLGAANRDPAVFSEPDLFNIDRPNLRKHLGFAYGPHSCLGLHLARLEARIGLETLLSRLPDLQPIHDEPMILQGYEFRQPKQLRVSWSP
jgi:cytochrome P450